MEELKGRAKAVDVAKSQVLCFFNEQLSLQILSTNHIVLYYPRFIVHFPVLWLVVFSFMGVFFILFIW